MADKILIVDDEREIADLAALYLENENFAVQRCYGGEEALTDIYLKQLKTVANLGKDLLSYKNYCGTVEYSKEDKCLFGKVIGIKSLLSYEGESVGELEQDFQNVLEEYFEDCRERGVEPERPYKGSFHVRISPKLHRNIAIYAMEHGKSLNAAVEEAIGKMVGYHAV